MKKEEIRKLKKLIDECEEAVDLLNDIQGELEVMGRERDSKRFCKAKDLVYEWQEKWTYKLKDVEEHEMAYYKIEANEKVEIYEDEVDDIITDYLDEADEVSDLAEEISERDDIDMLQAQEVAYCEVEEKIRTELDEKHKVKLGDITIVEE